MIEMTLSSRHKIRNSSPGGLRPSTLPLGHGGSVSGANHYPRAPAQLSKFRNVKIAWALRMGRGRAFHKTGPAIEKDLDPVAFIRGTTNVFEFVERKYFEHLGRTSMSPDMQVGCLLGYDKLLCIFDKKPM